MNRFLLICLVFFLFACSYPFAKQDVLETDELFFTFDDPSLAKTCNEDSIRLTRAGKLDQAEMGWDDCIKSNPNLVPLHLNRLRFYYLLDEYEVVKSKIVLESPSRTSLTYQAILKELEVNNRPEERVVVLDALTRVKGWEFYAYEELANYYLQMGNFRFAEGYFNLILEANSFHENALFGMADINIQKENWSAVLDYAKSLQTAAKKNKDFHFYFLKANYELGRYEEAIKWVESATLTEKSTIAFLEVWRDTLMVLYDNPKWDAVLPHYRTAVEKGYLVPESVFFPGLDKNSKELRSLIRTGRN
ncbi:hypothetical protein P3G55_01040 [Leptospira sp. 96542]|nr:hypothetical protein [Leptospira sp. 96542]